MLDASNAASAPPVFPTPVASPWRRAGAMLIDGVVVLGFLFATAARPLSNALGDWGTLLPDPPGSAWLEHPFPVLCYTLLLFGVCLLYCLPAVLPGRSNGRTLGHLICRTRMVRLDGQPVTLGNLARRWGLAFVLPLALIPLFPVLFLPVCFVWFVMVPALCFNRLAAPLVGESRSWMYDPWKGQGDRAPQDYFSGLQVVDRAYAPLPGPGISYAGGLKGFQFVSTPSNRAWAVALVLWVVVLMGTLVLGVFLGWDVSRGSPARWGLILFTLLGSVPFANFVFRCFTFVDYPIAPLSGPAAGFYPFPAGSSNYRYFDGSHWTAERITGGPKGLYLAISLALVVLGLPLVSAIADGSGPTSAGAGVFVALALCAAALIGLRHSLLPKLPLASPGRSALGFLCLALVSGLSFGVGGYLASREVDGVLAVLTTVLLYSCVFVWGWALFYQLRLAYIADKAGALPGRLWVFLLARLGGLAAAIILALALGSVLGVSLQEADRPGAFSFKQVFSGSSSDSSSPLSDEQFKDEVRRLAAGIQPGTFLTFDGQRLVACPKPDYNALGDCKDVGDLPPFDGLSFSPDAGYPAGTPGSAVWVTELSYLAYPRDCRAFIWQGAGGKLVKVTSACRR